MPDKKCKDCKHWNRAGNRDVGTCATDDLWLIVEVEFDPHDSTDTYANVPFVTLVGDDFSCMYWEKS